MVAVKLLLGGRALMRRVLSSAFIRYEIIYRNAYGLCRLALFSSSGRALPARGEMYAIDDARLYEFIPESLHLCFALLAFHLEDAKVGVYFGCKDKRCSEGHCGTAQLAQDFSTSRYKAIYIPRNMLLRRQPR